MVALVFTSLATSVFPETSPGLAGVAYAVMAGVAATLFFASLTAHELGHAVQARREGMHIDGITLWVFGGVARFTGNFPSAGAELRIALAGPAVSLVLAVVLLAAALGLDLPSGVDGVVFWLGQINLSLFVFNLLPALPLDGGRVLRAVLWMRRKDFQSATRTAAGLGRRFGQLMVAGGLLLVLFTGAFGALWLALIGLFLIGAAEAEAQMAPPESPLARLRVGDLMVPEPVSVRADTPLDRFMNDVFLARRYTAYPVTSADGSPLGIVSFRHAVAHPRAEWPRRTVADTMIPLNRSLVARRDGDLRDPTPNWPQTPSTARWSDDGRLAGLLSLTDVARILEAEAAGRRGHR